MTHTFSIVFSNRFNDAERVIGLFSATGYKIEKISMTKEVDGGEMSHLLIVTDIEPKDLINFRIRLSQQVRVFTVESFEGDRLPGERGMNLPKEQN